MAQNQFVKICFIFVFSSFYKPYNPHGGHPEPIRRRIGFLRSTRKRRTQSAQCGCSCNKSSRACMPLNVKTPSRHSWQRWMQPAPSSNVRMASGSPGTIGRIGANPFPHAQPRPHSTPTIQFDRPTDSPTATPQLWPPRATHQLASPPNCYFPNPDPAANPFNLKGSRTVG